MERTLPGIIHAVYFPSPIPPPPKEKDAGCIIPLPASSMSTLNCDIWVGNSSRLQMLWQRCLNWIILKPETPSALPGSSEVFTLRVTAYCSGKGIQLDKKSFGSPSNATLAFEINSFLNSTHLGFPWLTIIISMTQSPFWRHFFMLSESYVISSLYNVTLFHVYRVIGPDEKGKEKEIKWTRVIDSVRARSRAPVQMTDKSISLRTSSHGTVFGLFLKAIGVHYKSTQDLK